MVETSNDNLKLLNIYSADKPKLMALYLDCLSPLNQLEKIKTPIENKAQIHKYMKLF